jgi:hypothetical protein
MHFAIAGLLVFVGAVFVTAPFLLSGRISRWEEANGAQAPPAAYPVTDEKTSAAGH